MSLDLEERGEEVADAFYEMRVMWGRYQAMSDEERAGAKFSKATLAVLRSLCADMKDASATVSSWVPKLQELLGDNGGDDASGNASTQSSGGNTPSGQDAPAASTSTDGSSRARRSALRAKEARLLALYGGAK